MQKLKIDDQGHAVLVEGKPVYIDEDGKEIPVDVPQMYNKILDLNKENKSVREAKQTAEEKLKLFDGIEDLAEYKAEADKAITTIANFNDKDFLKASEVENLKKQMTEGHEKEVTDLRESFTRKENDYKGTIEKKDGYIRNLLITSNFASSPLFSGDNPKTILSPDVAESFFGRHFKVEEQKDGTLGVRAYYSNGDLIYSRARAGEPADFNEGMEEIFEKYPGKDKYIKAKSGSGSENGNDGVPAGDKIGKLKQMLEKENNPAVRISLKNQISDLEKQKNAS